MYKLHLGVIKAHQGVLSFTYDSETAQLVGKEAGYPEQVRYKPLGVLFAFDEFILETY